MSTPRLIGDVRSEHNVDLSHPFHTGDNEINLIELLNILIKGKFVIIACIAIAVLGSICVSYLLPQRWTSSAVVIVPQATQLQSIERMRAALQVLDVETDISPDSLLSEFMRNFDSHSLREKYLVSTDYFKQRVKNKAYTPQMRHRLINSILQSNISSRSSTQDGAGNKKEYRYYDLTYSAENPVIARDLLQGYIHYVTTMVENDVYQRIRYQIELRKRKAIGKYNLDKERAETAHRINLERLQYALEIARAAGLQKPSWSKGFSNQDDPDFPVTLGADGLDRKLKIFESLESPTMLNVDLQNRHLYIAKINALNINRLHFQPFQFMRAPVEPIQPDAPKRALIVLLSALAGLIAGCGYVLLNAAMTSYRQRMNGET